MLVIKVRFQSLFILQPLVCTQTSTYTEIFTFLCPSIVSQFGRSNSLTYCGELRDQTYTTAILSIKSEAAAIIQLTEDTRCRH